MKKNGVSTETSGDWYKHPASRCWLESLHLKLELRKLCTCLRKDNLAIAFGYMQVFNLDKARINHLILSFGYMCGMSWMEALIHGVWTRYLVEWFFFSLFEMDSCRHDVILIFKNVIEIINRSCDQPRSKVGTVPFALYQTCSVLSRHSNDFLFYWQLYPLTSLYRLLLSIPSCYLINHACVWELGDEIFGPSDAILEILLYGCFRSWWRLVRSSTPNGYVVGFLWIGSELANCQSLCVNPFPRVSIGGVMIGNAAKIVQ